MTFQIAFVLLCFAVLVHLSKHLYLMIRDHRETAERARMIKTLDWNNTNLSTRKRRESEKQTRWQKYGITN